MGNFYIGQRKSRGREFDEFFRWVEFLHHVKTNKRQLEPVIGLTNRHEALDSALRRPGRSDFRK